MPIQTHPSAYIILYFIPQDIWIIIFVASISVASKCFDPLVEQDGLIQQGTGDLTGCPLDTMFR